jgi:polysaccharide export outer membrane protein
MEHTSLKQWLISILTAILFLHTSIGMANALPTYHILPGDTLSVSVWGDDSMQMKDLQVLPDGSISFPLAGRVDAAGQTSTDVEHAIAERLKTYLKDPKVTVIITATSGSNVYIVGKIAKPGPVPLTGPLTVLQALSVGGLFDKFADTSNIKVLRNTAQGTTIFPVNYDELIKGRNLSSNIELLPGDTILVP